MTPTRHLLVAALVVVVAASAQSARADANQTSLNAPPARAANATAKAAPGMRRRQGAAKKPPPPPPPPPPPSATPLSDFMNASAEVRADLLDEEDDNAPFDPAIAGSLYEMRSMPENSADTRFTIQNVFSGEYLYVDDSRGVDDSVVQTGSVETIQAKHSRHALFRLEWNEDLYVRIVCVDNEVMLTGTLAPHVENHPVAPVIGSRIRSAAALWSLGEISWSPEAGDTMFIINHKYTDFLFAIGDPSKKKPALTTRHVKFYGLARSRWIVRPFHD